MNLGVVSGDAFGNLVFPVLYSGPYTATLEGEVDGVGLVGIGMLPIGERFRLFGKAGGFYSNADVSFKVRTPILTVSGTEGSFTSIFWNRRTRARSFSKCWRYSL